MKLPPELGSGCGGRWQTAKEAAPKKQKAAKKKAAPKMNEPGCLPYENGRAFERAGV